ncbi:DUF397 domain-containing protein [Jiangella muralis]|uniref:DUF397 domain-containing protein n=1 Tax=Jiangella muralis TaxID=702383 RepID=UPI0009F93B31|nr:DUF397 domain-containing protein [Jiangella muralis]
MDKIDNGIIASDIPAARWRKSTRSGAQGNCVEVAPLPTGAVAVRNSRHPDGPALVFTHDEMTAFVDGAKAGEFEFEQPETSAAPTADVDDGTPTHYEAIGNELASLTGRLLEGEATLDRDSSERLLRLLTGISQLQRQHQVDSDGNCAICRPRSRRWGRSSECSVHVALSTYLGASLMVPAGAARH